MSSLADSGKGVLCKVLQVSRAGYYAWRNRRPSALQEANDRLLRLLRKLFSLHRKRYGYRRIHEVAHKEIPCGKHRVARLMRQRRAYRVTTQSKHKPARIHSAIQYYSPVEYEAIYFSP